MDSNVIGFYILIGIILFSLISGFLIRKIRGSIGEGVVKGKLNGLPSDSYRVFNDVIIPGYNNGSTQIDHVVVSKYGIFVIETKNMVGKIYGGAKAKEWTKYSKGRKLTFMNPLHQNYGHIKALESLLNLPKDCFIGIVCFTQSSELKSDIKGVVYTNRLADEIRNHKDILINEDMVPQIVETIATGNMTSFETKREHIKDINRRKNLNDKIDQPICPSCGGVLVKRNGRYGEFLGCSNYPKCRYTKNI